MFLEGLFGAPAGSSVYVPSGLICSSLDQPQGWRAAAARRHVRRCLLLPLRCRQRTTRPLTMSGDQHSASIANKIELPNRLHLSFANFTHPCEGFSVSPPLVDKKHTGPRPCPVCYVSVDQAIALMPLQPSPSPVLKNLNYVSEDSISANLSNQSSIFGGHPALEERNKCPAGGPPCSASGASASDFSS